jgi:hypothetical protein
VSFALARKNINPRTASALVEGLVQMGRCYPSRIGSFARNALQSDVCHMVVGTKSLSSYQQRMQPGTLMLIHYSCSSLCSTANTLLLGRSEGVMVLRLAYTEAVARSINLHVFQTPATDSFETVYACLPRGAWLMAYVLRFLCFRALLCILALLSDEEQFQRQGSLLADQIEVRRRLQNRQQNHFEKRINLPSCDYSYT